MMKDQTALDVAPNIVTSALPKDDRPAGAEQLAQRIRQAVKIATSARIHNLLVTVTGTHIVLDGFCSTFHCYQLAQHAAMQHNDDLPVDNQIQVL